MINILVPTDFSPLSKIAIRYAVRIANKLGGNVTLLHVINFQRTMRSTIKMETNSRDFVKAINDQLEEIVNEITSEIMVTTPIRCEIAKGKSFSKTIIKESKKLKSGLIVMGTRGATGLKKALLGSNTVSVLEASHVPVLAVPEEAEFETFRNIIYATDLQDLEKELATLIPYVERFGSTIHVLHIVEDGMLVPEAEERINTIIKKLKYDNIVTLVTMDFDVNAAIDQYISVSKADLVTMFTQKTSFYDKVFDKSLTRRMAFHGTIPLLAFQQ
ncbi:MAG TPA: universal stress protein [Chryseosolibacter sp.]|nr:universal stress protein [Chryseosolibacter sp.]